MGKHPERLWLSTGVLLVAAVMLIGHAYDLSMWYDELWSVFHSTASLDQIIIHDRVFTWPPGYYILLHFWIEVFGQHDLALKMMHALGGMLGIACTIRAGQALASPRAGWLAGLAFAVSSFGTTMMLDLHGYAPVLMLAPAAVWFHARWLRRPGWRRALPYGLALALLLWVRFSDPFVIIGLMGLHVLIVRPRAITRWMGVIAGVGVLVLPLMPQAWELFLYRRETGVDDPDPMFLRGPEMIYRSYSAHQDVLWAIILVLALAGLVWGLWRSHVRRQNSRAAWGTALWLALWGLAVPAVAYLLRAELMMYYNRYLTFTVPAVMLLIGIGLARLPWQGSVTGAALLLVFLAVPWRPFDFRRPYVYAPPTREMVRALAERWAPGDVLLMDPNMQTMSEPYDWWYYEPLYFPLGEIPRVSRVEEAGSRLWYLVGQSNETPGLPEAVGEGRIMTEFWGPWYFIATLYEAPPLAEGVRMGETAIHFRGDTLTTGTLYRPGDTLRVETWWSVDGPVDRDYSLGLHLVDGEGHTVAQTDSGPTGEHTPGATSAWQPGAIYRDDRALTLPWCLKTAPYEVRLVVYYWEDGVPLRPAATKSGTEIGDSLLLDTITVASFAECEQNR